jgi:hypothetical protein
MVTPQYLTYKLTFQKSYRAKWKTIKWKKNETIWIPYQEWVLWNQFYEERKAKFIEEVRRMEWGYLAYCLTVADQILQPKDQSDQYFLDVKQAYELIKAENPAEKEQHPPEADRRTTEEQPGAVQENKKGAGGGASPQD